MRPEKIEVFFNENVSKNDFWVDLALHYNLALLEPYALELWQIEICYTPKHVVQTSPPVLVVCMFPVLILLPSKAGTIGLFGGCNVHPVIFLCGISAARLFFWPEYFLLFLTIP